MEPHQRPADGAEFLDLAILKAEGAHLASRREVFAETAGDGAELRLHLLSAADDLFADESNGQHTERDHGQTDEHESHAAFVERHPE